uniref:Ig-like domain-containing protein n=1 Tax=Oncorhynchus tshawytscha TaxID=74940 RepID=A0A8C8JX13_ONCTS
MYLAKVYVNFRLQLYNNMLEQCLICCNYYQHHSLSYIILLSFHLFHLSVISSVVTTTILQPREVAAPGSDITLRCSLGGPQLLPYYHGGDQLERQSVVYKGRTHLFEDQLTVGNASLRLSGVQPSDQGPYTCDVTDEQGSTQEKLQLLVAAPYDEPRISIQATCDGFVVTLSASQGFPQPEAVWKGVMGSTNTTMELDSKGVSPSFSHSTHHQVKYQGSKCVCYRVYACVCVCANVCVVHNTLLQFIKHQSDIEGNVVYFSY